MGSVTVTITLPRMHTASRCLHHDRLCDALSLSLMRTQATGLAEAGHVLCHRYHRQTQRRTPASPT